jgi:hypothetical protein
MMNWLAVGENIINQEMVKYFFMQKNKYETDRWDIFVSLKDDTVIHLYEETSVADASHKLALISEGLRQ